MHYYSHHIGDFQRDTASLSDADTLAYLRLIWMYYDTEQPLPNQPEELAFKIGASADKVAIILKSYFYLDNDLWRHRRCDDEIAKVYAKSEAARNKAKKRWGNAAAMQQQHKEHVDLHNAFGELLESQSNAEAMLQHSHSSAVELENDATHKPNKNNKEVVEKPEEVSDKVWNDFLKSRKVKKALVTPLVIEQITDEAKKAGWTLEKALTEIVVRNWTSFKAGWVKDKGFEEKSSASSWMNDKRIVRAK